MDGPCWECEEMREFFAGKSWRTLGAKGLRRHGGADALFTIKAYCHLLPAYLVAAIREPRELDVCVDHLAYRFGPEPGDPWSNGRLAEVLRELTPDERAAVRAMFLRELSWDVLGQRTMAAYRSLMDAALHR
jgi:hypothetical protein